MKRSSGATRKRPKFLSLRSQLSPPDDSPAVPSSRLRPLRHYYTRRNRRCSDKHQLPKLSLLHPPCSSLAVESCQAIDDHAALLFSSSDDASATLKDLLNCRDEETCTTVAGTSGEESVSLRCAYGGSGPQLRSAMKSGYNSRDGCKDHEEKWVRFSEVVEKKDEEVSSNYRTAVAAAALAAGGLLSLSLKLDYQEILDTWSDRGSLFICRRIGTEESPQTVPDLFPEFDSFGRVRSRSLLPAK
ncbi:hypothetical protein MLD38_001082 [Melastoma candidum]|uniref:Uncharacterized protein n=1 Tax=Melastoma candidum TaxID=119954 RepID=A0ACB9SC43_9MYRT|nr:hypothetical protein MLD38_001082 [Melastoma candidum]